MPQYQAHGRKTHPHDSTRLPWQTLGNSKKITGPVGFQEHASISLTHAHIYLAIWHWKKMWFASSCSPHKVHLPFDGPCLMCTCSLLSGLPVYWFLIANNEGLLHFTANKLVILLHMLLGYGTTSFIPIANFYTFGKIVANDVTCAQKYIAIRYFFTTLIERLQISSLNRIPWADNPHISWLIPTVCLTILL